MSSFAGTEGGAAGDDDGNGARAHQQGLTATAGVQDTLHLTA